MRAAPDDFPTSNKAFVFRVALGPERGGGKPETFFDFRLEPDKYDEEAARGNRCLPCFQRLDSGGPHPSGRRAQENLCEGFLFPENVAFGLREVGGFEGVGRAKNQPRPQRPGSLGGLRNPDIDLVGLDSGRRASNGHKRGKRQDRKHGSKTRPVESENEHIPFIHFNPALGRIRAGVDGPGGIFLKQC